MRLENFPRLKLTFGPTPVEKFDRLGTISAAASSSGPSGRTAIAASPSVATRSRKLEYLIPEAIAQNATRW